MSRWCLAVSHGLPRGWFLVWRCVLHGRVSSFFRASESSVRLFLRCGRRWFRVLPYCRLGSAAASKVGGLRWPFVIGLPEATLGLFLRLFAWFWLVGLDTVEFHLSLGHQKAALGSFFAVRFWLVWARVSVVFGCFAWAAERLVFGLEVRFARSSFIFL